MNIFLHLASMLHSKAPVFWQNWSLDMQRRTALVFFCLVVLTGILAWSGLHTATRRTAEEAQQLLERHATVAGMVQEIRMLEGGRAESLVGTPILIAARQISRDIGLEDKLSSVRPALQSAGRDGVQLYYERLDLKELISLLDALQQQAGLKTSTLTMNRRLDNPKRADLQLVLFR